MKFRSCKNSTKKTMNLKDTCFEDHIDQKITHNIWTTNQYHSYTKREMIIHRRAHQAAIVTRFCLKKLIIIVLEKHHGQEMRLKFLERQICYAHKNSLKVLYTMEALLLMEKNRLLKISKLIKYDKFIHRLTIKTTVTQDTLRILINKNFWS